MSRLSELDPSQLSAEQKQVHDAILASRGNLAGPFAAWLHSPALADRAQRLGEYVRYHTSLPPRLSELAILVVARHFASEMEWAIHEPIARQQGLAVEVIDSIFDGKGHIDGDAEMQTVHRYVAELLETRHVSDHTFQQAVDLFGEAAVVELTLLVGYYALVAFSLNAFQIPIPAEMKPRRAWDSRST
jgi:4-carboxymuconolactone decarboxylase